MERRVYYWHLKVLGYCNRQLRVWCKKVGYPWRKLTSEGINADFLLSVDNTSYAFKAVEFAESTGWSKEPISVVE
jgi:hypothetical protein